MTDWSREWFPFDDATYLNSAAEGRLRQVARRIRGDKGGGGSKARAGGQTRSTRQTSTPRKAGGS